MEKPKIRIEKRGTVKHGYIYLAFLTEYLAFRYPCQDEHLVTVANSEAQMDERLFCYKQRFGNDLEIVGSCSE